MAKTMEMKGTLKLKISNPGQRDVKYEAELILSDKDKFELQQDLLTTELTVAVRSKMTK
uniref:Uncharacterized protein n=1 Tax=viral metagenome TaxID=1070528 RepID=A0A6M3LXG2_9ZZZZ